MNELLELLKTKYNIDVKEREGDKVVFTRNDREVGIDAGDSLTRFTVEETARYVNSAIKVQGIFV